MNTNSSTLPSSNVNNSSNSTNNNTNANVNSCSDGVVAGCFCTSFESNMYRPQVCLACFHKRSEHSLPNNACGWKNLPEVKRTLTRKTISVMPTTSSKPEINVTPASIPASISTTPSSTSSTNILSNIKRKISSDNPTPSSISKPTPITKTDAPWVSRSFSKTQSGSTSQTNLIKPIPTKAKSRPNSPRNANDVESNSTEPNPISPRVSPSTPPPHSTAPNPTTPITNPTTPTPTPTSNPTSPTTTSPSSPTTTNSTTSSTNATNPTNTTQDTTSTNTVAAKTPRFHHPSPPPATTPSSSNLQSPSSAPSPPSHTPASSNSQSPSSAPLPPSHTPTPAQPTVPPPTKFSPKLVRRNAVMIAPAKNYAQEYSTLQNFDAAECCSRMIRNLIWMNGVSVDEKFVKEFLIKMESETTKHKPNVPWERRHIRDQALLGLSIKHDIEHVLLQQGQLQKIVIVQSCVRRYLVKKHVAKLKQYQQSPHKERNAIFRDLLKGERGYVSNLNLIVMSYMNPLKATLRSTAFLSSFTLTISPEDLQSIFSNVEVLLRVHATVLGEFEMLVDKWPIIEDIGAIFLKKASELRVYGEYVKNFQTALHTLTRLQEENTKFAQFLSERMHRNYGDPGLMSLISCPLNQISQYSILLERLVHVTPVSHRDHEKLTAASILMKEIYKLLQDSIEQTNNSAKLMDLQRRLMPHSVDFELVVPSRMFVCEGGVIHYHKKKKRNGHYALFSDMLLLCRIKKSLLKVKYHFPYSQIVIEEDLALTLLPPGIDTSSTPACGLVVPKDKLVLVFNNKHEHKVFLNKAKPLCEQANPTRKVFGSSLVALLKREKTTTNLPTALVAMVEAIKKQVHVEGIFRVSGTVQSLHALRDAIEHDETDLKDYDVHTICNALKAFFREMPEPLMTFPAYDDLASIAEDQQLPSRLQALRVVIANMPKPNRNVLQYLIAFLAHVASFSDKNKMNFTNLAIVMGPNLVRPLQNTLETTLMMPKLNSIVADLMEHASKVFDKMDI